MRHSKTLVGRTTTTLAVIVALAALGACGSDGDAHDGDHVATAEQTAPNGDVFNGADIEFATSMIPHHAQAVQMTVLAQGRPLDPPVQDLVSQIRDAQVPEIETMTDWLTAWGEEVPETSLDHANAGHDMDDMNAPDGMEDMPGMMSEEDMDALAAAAESEFQAMWLEMMMEHHQGAVEMAVAEQTDGKFDDAVKLAETIEASQVAEIADMEKLLN